VAKPFHPLATAQLIRAEVPAGAVWHHIFLSRFPDPLGFGFSASRFSDPRKEPPQRFRVYYVGQSFEVAFLETIVRDRKSHNPGTLALSESDLDDYVHVSVRTEQSLDVVDLRAGAGVALGLPTDALRAKSHRLGQRASLALHEHPVRPDGIWYPSRLNGEDNLAVYDRALPKLSAGLRRQLRTCPELASVLNRYRLTLV
jgi:hypothetical protein